MISDEPFLSVLQDFSEHYAAQPHQLQILVDAALRIPMGGVIVELGVCNGRTAAAFSIVARQHSLSYYGVDFFGLEGDAETIRAKFAKHGLEGKIIEGNTHTIGKLWNTPIDLLFIDAGHDEANVKPDIEIWLPHLKSEGTVFFHDYDDPYDPSSPHWAIRHYADLYTEGWERKIHPGMLEARKPK